MGGFLSAAGRKVVDEDGDEVRLRGVGIGNWLLPEGYMWRLPASADRPRRMERLVADLVGETHANEFWQAYRDRFVCEEDIAELAAAGYNSVRLPINARLILAPSDGIREPGVGLLREDEMSRIDRLVGWCRDHGVYVVLDLHGAPGGQTGTNIDDSEHDLPELFIDDAFAERTVDLWRELAARYADEWIVAGYDLLNEPLPDWFAHHNHRVLPLYRRITEAIRTVDRRHTIILEGVHWATDWSIFTERVDDNLVLEFHKYWNNPDRESLAPYLDLRESWNVPIFMGEGGENNTDWYTGAFRLYDDLDISWNFWTWKKMDTCNSPLSIRRPEGWARIVAAADHQVELARDEARTILGEYAENVASDRCDRHPEVTNALFRRGPVRVPAIFYANAPAGVGFHTPTPVPEPEAPRFRSTDRVPMAFVGRDGTPALTGEAPSFQHGGGEPWSRSDWIGVLMEERAWFAYDLEIASAGRWLITVSGIASDPTRLELSTGDSLAAVRMREGAAEQTREVEMELACGPHRLTVRCLQGRLYLTAIACIRALGTV